MVLELLHSKKISTESHNPLKGRIQSAFRTYFSQKICKGPHTLGTEKLSFIIRNTSGQECISKSQYK